MEEAAPKDIYFLYVLVFSTCWWSNGTTETGCRKVNKWGLDLNRCDAVWFMLLVLTCS